MPPGRGNLASSDTFGIRPSSGGSDRIIQYGGGAIIPAPGDYDGDGKTDLSVYGPTPDAFAIRKTLEGKDYLYPFGTKGYGQTYPVTSIWDFSIGGPAVTPGN